MHRLTRLVYVLPPYLAGSMLASIFCLIIANAALYDGKGIPLGVTAGVFASMGVLAVLCFRLAEPRTLARMLRRAVRDNGASGGVVVRTSLESATSLTNALAPVEGGYRTRASRAEVAMEASFRLVIVSVGDGLMLVTSRAREFVAVPTGHFRIVDMGGAGAIEIQLPGAAPVTLEAIEPTRWGFEPMAVEAVERALRLQ